MRDFAQGRRARAFVGIEQALQTPREFATLIAT